MTENENSYKHILKAIGFFGSSQLIQILTGIIRTKVIAVVLGATGFGIISVLQNIVQIFTSTGILGFDTGSVRKIALIKNLNDSNQLARIVAITKSWFKGLAITASLFCLAFCYPISYLAFSSHDYALLIAFLFISVFFTILGRANYTILQATNNVEPMVKVSIFGNILSLAAAIPLYLIFGLQGIVPSLIITSIIQFFFAWKYADKLRIAKVTVARAESWNEGKDTLRFGIAVMVAAVANTLTMFLIRAFIIRRLGLDSAGLFQAVWTISNTYMLMVLNSMSADYFPRLSAVSEDKARMDKAINEQTFVVLNIITPVIVLIMVFGQQILRILYSSEFIEVEKLLNWQLLGTFLKVASWPMAFIMLAKGKGTHFVFSEISFFLVYFICVFVLFPYFGLDATGVGYLLAYVFYFVLIFLYAKTLFAYHWPSKNLQTFIVASVLIILAFGLGYITGMWKVAFGLIILALSIFWAYRNLREIIDFKSIMRKIRKR